MKNSLEFLESFLPKNWDKTEGNVRVYEHSLIVAKAAKTIAENTENLDPERSFLYGLTHDVGKFFLPKREFYKHPRIGYELMENERNDIAEICLSHPFPNLDLKSYFIYYCDKDALEAAKIERLLKGIKTSDYIELIQLCDKLSGLNEYMTIETKFSWYKNNYQIDETSSRLNYEKLIQIKSKFDIATKNDVYALLGI